MTREDILVSPVWALVREALTDYGNQLVLELRSSKNTHDHDLEVKGALTAVDEMLAIPDRLFDSRPDEALSQDNKSRATNTEAYIKPFHVRRQGR